MSVLIRIGWMDVFLELIRTFGHNNKKRMHKWNSKQIQSLFWVFMASCIPHVSMRRFYLEFIQLL